MPWSAPTNVNAGDLLTAANHNTYVFDNLRFLHDRYAVLWVYTASGAGGASGAGDYAGQSVSNAGEVYLNFLVPDDFSALVSAEVLLLDGTGGTLTYAIATDYHNPDNNELYNNHSGGASGLTVALTASVPELVSLASYLSSLAAGDFVGLKLTSTTSPSGALKILGVRLIYSRS